MLNHETDLSRVFYALSDPTRRALVEQLLEGESVVSELASPHAMTLAAILQHLQILEKCGLIRTYKTGRVRTCKVQHKALTAAELWLRRNRQNQERSSDLKDAIRLDGGKAR